MKIVLVLIIIIVGLLLLIANKDGDKTASLAPVVQASENFEKESISARQEVEVLRKKVTELTNRLRGLNAEADAKQAAVESKLTESVTQKRAADEKMSGLQAEVVRLDQLVRRASAAEEERSSAAEVPTLPHAEETLYWISGLRPGDTLNVRGGPGVHHPVVNQLHEGVRVTATGPPVSNGPDSWLPCLILDTVTDPDTGLSHPREQSGWINSMFVEEIQTL